MLKREPSVIINSIKVNWQQRLRQQLIGPNIGLSGYKLTLDDALLSGLMYPRKGPRWAFLSSSRMALTKYLYCIS